MLLSCTPEQVDEVAERVLGFEETLLLVAPVVDVIDDVAFELTRTSRHGSFTFPDDP
jgi:hypothetical protein